MLSLQILNDLNIPLCIIGNLSFSKAANVIPTSRLKLRVRGYQCRELNISLSLTPNVVDLFNEVNIIQFETFSDLVKYFLEIQPSRDLKPFSVFLANNCLVPELLFTITSVTQTFQSDINGDVKELSISMTLSGTKCSKKSFVEPVVLYDDTTTIPSVTIHNNNKEIKCQDSISISDFRLTPTTCNLELIISDSFKEKSDNAWLFDITQSNNSFTNFV